MGHKVSIIIIGLSLLISCSKNETHKCVCYQNLGTDSVTYTISVINNNYEESKKNCENISCVLEE